MNLPFVGATGAFTLLALPALSAGDPSKIAAPVLPLREFFRNPQRTGYALSPDGSHVTFLMPWQNRLNAHVQKIGQQTVTRVTESTARDIAAVFWLSNGRLGYIQDSGGDENYHFYAVDRNGDNRKDLTPFPETQANMIDDLKDDDAHVLVALNKRDARYFDAYRLEINTGALTLLVENPGLYNSYLADHEGRLRLATGSRGTDSVIYYRDSEDQPFREVLKTHFRDTVAPLRFSYDNGKLFGASNLGRDKEAVVLMSLPDLKAERVLFEHPDVDVDRILSSDAREIVTGVAFLTDKRTYHFFDADRAAMQRWAEEQLPGVEVSVVDHSRDETKFLVRTSSDRTLGSWYCMEWPSRKLIHLAEISPWLKPEGLAEMKPISFSARDGLTIRGYLTLPTGRKPKNLPALAVVHGGPWARDHWGFDPEVQFLANRGYAVLQVNYRGSTGYGRKFWESSFKRWGREMQDDISDGVKWLIGQGIADPRRVGISGGSYGGYATLAGLAFSPELYACGVDYVGVANLLTFMNTIPPYWEQERQQMYAMVGDPEKDLELMKAASPALQAEKIKAPLLVAQGKNDARVNIAESNQMVAALRARGVSVPYMVKDNEGHGFANEENRFDFYRAMEQFLARHLGGAKEENPDVLASLLATPTTTENPRRKSPESLAQ
ncbi:MAG: alpha/beta hydrolase family protein [Verrucomicrobiales bacterium]